MHTGSMNTVLTFVQLTGYQIWKVVKDIYYIDYSDYSEYSYIHATLISV